MKLLSTLGFVGLVVVMISGCGSKDNGGSGNPYGQPATSQQVQGHWVATSFHMAAAAGVPAHDVTPDAQGYFNGASVEPGLTGRYKYYLSVDPSTVTVTKIDDQGSPPIDDPDPYTFQGNSFVGTDQGRTRTVNAFISGNSITVQRDDGDILHYNRIADADYLAARSQSVVNSTPQVNSAPQGASQPVPQQAPAVAPNPPTNSNPDPNSVPNSTQNQSQQNQSQTQKANPNTPTR